MNGHLFDIDEVLPTDIFSLTDLDDENILELAQEKGLSLSFGPKEWQAAFPHIAPEKVCFIPILNSELYYYDRYVWIRLPIHEKDLAQSAEELKQI